MTIFYEIKSSISREQPEIDQENPTKSIQPNKYLAHWQVYCVNKKKPNNQTDITGLLSSKWVNHRKKDTKVIYIYSRE